jgi:hypothetical protein
MLHISEPCALLTAPRLNSALLKFIMFDPSWVRRVYLGQRIHHLSGHFANDLARHFTGQRLLNRIESNRRVVSFSSLIIALDA